MKNNDAQLIHRILDGDDTAFAELVEKYKKQVHGLVWRKIGDFHIAEEITQDTFLKAYQKLGTLKKPQRFASWLYVIAANRCKTWLHKKHIRKKLLEDNDITQSEEVTYSKHVHQENERITVETQRDVVQKLLAKLGESERTVMTLHYLGEMSCTEIGEFLGVSANTVKSRLHRAQQRLQKEETMIREALDNYQISPNLTETIMEEISHTKPATPTGSKPLVPWAIAASTLAVVLLVLGFGNSRYMTRFQKPYSFDAIAEMTVEIVDAPIVANLESKQEVRPKTENINILANLNDPEEQQNDNNTTISEDTQTEETLKDYTQWELPKAAKARLGKGRVNDIKFTPDGTRFAVGTSIGVWLYDANTGGEITLLTENKGVDRAQGKSYINVLAFSTDGNTLACGDYYGNIEIWDLETKSLKSTFTGNRMPVKALMFTAEDTKLACAIGWGGVRWGNEGIAMLWNLTDNSNQPIVAALENTKAELHVVFSPDGHYLAAACASVYIGKRDGIPAIQLWDVDTDQLLFNVEKHAQNIETIAFSPNGRILASAEGSNGIRLWHVDSGTLLSTLKAATLSKVLAFSPDNHLLATGSSDGIVQLWDITAIGRRLIRTFEGNANDTELKAIAFSPDGKSVVSAYSDGTVRLWEVDSENQQFTLAQNSGSISALAFNDINRSKLHDSSGKPNHANSANRTLTGISLSNSQVYVSVWDIDTGSEISTDMVDNSSEKTSKVAVSPDASLFVTRDIIGFDDNVVRLWDTHTRRLLCVLGGKEKSGGFGPEVVFSSDGQFLAVSSRKDNTIQIWDVPNRKTRCRLKGHTTGVYSLAFSPDNKIVVSSGWTTKDMTVRLWDTMTGTEIARLQEQGAVEFAQDSNSFAAGKHIYSRNLTTGNYENIV